MDLSQIDSSICDFQFNSTRDKSNSNWNQFGWYIIFAETTGSCVSIKQLLKVIYQFDKTPLITVLQNFTYFSFWLYESLIDLLFSKTIHLSWERISQYDLLYLLFQCELVLLASMRQNRHVQTPNFFAQKAYQLFHWKRFWETSLKVCHHQVVGGLIPRK